MNGIHIMTDIETLGKRDGATIFQIAAAAFDIKTGELKETINLKMDIAKERNLKVYGDTLKWWLNTDKELLAKLLNEGTLTEVEMLNEFYCWIKSLGNNIKLWGNGILFDNMKLKLKMESLNIPYPISYKNDRDVRTILDLASAVSGLTENEIKKSIKNENEVAHDALDDVRSQVRLVSTCYNIIKK